ncbi:MAG: hypothetical protein AB1925_15690 [Actinomycetota bacterium]
MNLSEKQVNWAATALKTLITERRRGGNPVAREWLALYHHLVTFADESPAAVQKSPSTHDADWINAAAAAEILSLTPCRVRQIRADLGGQRCPCGQGWVFRRRDVIDYAAAKSTG